MQHSTTQIGYRAALRTVLLVVCPLWIAGAAFVFAGTAAALRARGMTVRVGLLVAAGCVWGLAPVGAFVATFLPDARRRNSASTLFALLAVLAHILITCGLMYLSIAF
jgi:hypothetical protein